VAPFLTRRSPLTRDLIIAGLWLAFTLSVVVFAMSTVWFPARPADYFVVAIVTAVAWPLSRLAPKSTLLVVAAIAALPWIWTFVAPEVRIVPLAVAAFRAAQLGGAKRYVIPILAITTPFVAVHNLLSHIVNGDLVYPHGYAWTQPSVDIMLMVTVAVVAALGYAVHRQQQAVHRQQQIAEDLNRQNAELIALRASERERVAIEVRTAIARDIHDVVAHHVAAMVVTAQAADRVADRDPALLRTTVRAIAVEGNEALAAMRQVVQVLRQRPNSDRSFETALRELTDRLGTSGRRVTVSGEIAGTTEIVRDAVLRIVQESLTNVLLHSDAEHISVSFATTGSDIEVRVEDRGQRSETTPPTHAGNGIRGMRERARALGGQLSAGPRAEGGWTVRAVLPRTGSAVLA
jgi:signal transduction histidine kinase